MLLSIVAEAGSPRGYVARQNAVQARVTLHKLLVKKRRLQGIACSGMRPQSLRLIDEVKYERKLDMMVVG